MVNRILIRIKVVQIVYSYLKGDKDLATAEKELFFSMDKAYDLYHYLLLLMIELTDAQTMKLENAKAKYMPTDTDLNPNMKFVQNLFIESLRNNIELSEYISAQKLSWVNNQSLIKKLLEDVLTSELYEEYMSQKERSYDSDKEFWRSALKDVILTSELLSDILEDQSLYWNDDLETIGTFVMKTIRRFSEDETSNKLLPMYKDTADMNFAKILFRNSIMKAEDFRTKIDESAKNWELDRIAFMDIVIMIVALAEITSFDSIPVKVSLNEYIEIAKSYSTPKSGKFNNGMLDSIVTKMKKSGELNKS